MAQVVLKIKIDLPGLRSELAEVIKEITTKLEPLGVLEFQGDTADLLKGLEDVTEEVNETDEAAGRTRNTLAQWGMILSGYQAMLSSIQQVWSVITKPLDVAGEFEQYNTQFEVLLGGIDQAEKRIAELTDFAALTPFEMPGIVKASLQLQNLTKGVLATGPGLTMIGDVAAGVNQPIEELSTWFGRLYDGIQNNRPVGEALMRLQELGILSGEARGEIEDLQKANADSVEVWAVVTNEMSKFNGMMEKQSKNYLGLKSTASDVINLLVADLGEKMLPAAKEATESFIEGVELIRENLDLMITLIHTAGATFVVYQIAVNGVTMAVTAYSTITKGAAIATRIFNTAMKSNPIGLVASAVAGLIVLLGELTNWFGLAADEQDNFTESTDKATEASRKLKEELSDLRAIIDKKSDTDLIQTIKNLNETLKLPDLDASRLEYVRNFLTEAEAELARRTKKNIQISKEAATLQVEAMEEGKRKEVAKLDLWYRIEKAKFKGKEDALLNLKKLYSKKHADIDNKYIKIAEKNANDVAKLKIDAMKKGQSKELAELELWYKQEQLKYANNTDALLYIEEIYTDRKKGISDKYVDDTQDVDELRIRNKYDGMEEELKLLDYQHSLELEKFKSNEDMKTELAKKHEQNRFDIMKKYSDQALSEKDKAIREESSSLQQFGSYVTGFLHNQFTEQSNYSDNSVELAQLRHREELNSLLDQYSKGELSKKEYDLRRISSEEQMTNYLKRVEDQRAGWFIKFKDYSLNYALRLGEDFISKYLIQKAAEALADTTTETTKTTAKIAGETARTTATTLAATERTTIFAAESGTQLAIANITMAELTIASVAAMTAIAAAASSAATLVSIATFGGAGVTGTAAVASGLALIRGMALAGFRKAGYTGEGNPDDVAGVVHKDEFVFESELVSREKGQFELLHKLLRGGMSLTQLFGKMAATVNPIIQPQLALSGVSLATPQISVPSSSNQSMGKIESLLLSMDKRLKNLESNPTVEEIKIIGEMEIKNKVIYIAFKKEEKLQKNRGIDVNN